MSDSRLSAWARPGALAGFRLRNRNRFDLVCEDLESRQLLSTASGTAPDPSQILALPSLQVLPLVSTGPTGLTPQQIASAYGVNQIRFSGGKVVGNGAGQTIAIVTAYNDPSIRSDLAAFDRQFGLPDPPSFNVGNLGGSTTDAVWALETSLDVEWAHALAPGANILLVEAASSSLSDLFYAVSAASRQTGVSVVSMSWGTTEFWGEWSFDSLFTTPAGHPGVTYVAASGDSGAWYGPMYPSVSPNVLAVGGATLTLSGSSYSSESGWAGSTGGFSGLDSNWWFYETEPSYQTAALQAVGLNYGVRTTPDVSFNADPNSGVAVYDSTSYAGQSGWFQLGGTSAAAPAWAGLVAIANQGLATGGKGPLLGTQAQAQLYALPSSDFHDITGGFNGYSATPGYDLVTGLGSPKANLVIAGLLAANGVSESPSPTQQVVSTSSTSSVTGSRLDLTTSTQGGTGTAIGSSTNLGSTGLSTAVLASSAGSGAQTGSIVAMQALSYQASTTQAQPVIQHAVATALISQGSTLTSLPAQSLPQRAVYPSTSTHNEEPAEPDWRIDDKAPAMPGAPVQEEAPAPAPDPEPEPAPVTEPSADPPVDDLPEESLRNLVFDRFDMALAQVSEGMAERRLELPPGRSSEREQSPTDQSSWSAPALAGTAALAAGGYRLILGRSDRIRRRWSQVRFR
jgi:subtilase family serine protease